MWQIVRLICPASISRATTGGGAAPSVIWPASELARMHFAFI